MPAVQLHDPLALSLIQVSHLFPTIKTFIEAILLFLNSKYSSTCLLVVKKEDSGNKLTLPARESKSDGKRSLPLSIFYVSQGRYHLHQMRSIVPNFVIGTKQRPF